MSTSDTILASTPWSDRDAKAQNRKPNVAFPERVASAVLGTALTIWAVSRRRDVGDATLAAAGGYLVLRGLTGQCMGYSLLRTGTARPPEYTGTTIAHGQGIKIEKTVTINRPAEELYRFWHNLENLPRFMKHLESVSQYDDKRSHWVVKAPMGQTVSWHAEIFRDIPNKQISWRSMEPADIPNAGTVRFQPLADNGGTEVMVTLEYNPPAGVLGAAIARLLGEEPGLQVTEDLECFKNRMEEGEAVSDKV